MAPARRIQGEVVFPADTARDVPARILIELRDVSVQDRASTVLAAIELPHARIGPNARVPFAFDAPATPESNSLGLRVQVDLHAGSRGAGGDYLSTVACPVPASGHASALVVPVTRL